MLDPSPPFPSATGTPAGTAAGFRPLAARGFRALRRFTGLLRRVGAGLDPAPQPTPPSAPERIDNPFDRFPNREYWMELMSYSPDHPLVRARRQPAG